VTLPLVGPVLLTEFSMPAPLLAPPEITLDAAVLSDIVSGLARADDLWRPHVAHDPRQRVRVRLLATAAYEVWLLGWTPGQSVGLHDHGDANGAFVVVDGELVESKLTSRGIIDTTVRPGGVGRIPSGAVHDVGNRSRRLATSIHAYSRPLTSMGFYGEDGTLVRIEAVHEQSALVTPAQLARALHPSR
jgi:quercetin dioxygenase-like cupin family protein